MDVVGDLWFSKRQGETLLKTFTFTNDDGSPLALTDPLMQGVRRNAPSDRIDFAPTVGGADGNVITITKTADETWPLTAGDYVWDLAATDVTNGQLVRLEGVFEVVPDLQPTAEPMSRVTVSESPGPTVVVDEGTVVETTVVPSPGPSGPTVVESGDGQQGPPGPPGTGSAGSAFTVTAATILSGHRVVAPRADGTVEYAGNDVPADAGRPLWLTTASATTGEPVPVVGVGIVEEPSWSWAPGPIWLAADGVLTQALPTTGFALQVASAVTPTSLFYAPRDPTNLA